jgi:hypothetical protein
MTMEKKHFFKFLFKNKKGTFDITIESIVILILAIIFLGLAITFVVVIFHESDINLADVFDSVTKQKIEQLKLSEKTFDLETYILDLKQGEKKIIFMLLKNDNNEEITINIEHQTSNISEFIDCSKISLGYKESIDILPGDVSVPPLVIKSDNDINKGTCLFEIKAGSEILGITVNII